MEGALVREKGWGRSQGLEGALTIREHQIFDCVCLDTPVKYCELRLKGGKYRECLFFVMVIQDQGFSGHDGVFLRFGNLVKDLMEIMGL